MKYLPIQEFVELGFLQEINRRLLHPCGLALEVAQAHDGSFLFSGIWNYRDDPEGIIYDEADPPDWRKRNRVNEARNVHMEARTRMGLRDPYLHLAAGEGIQRCPEPGEDV